MSPYVRIVATFTSSCGATPSSHGIFLSCLVNSSPRGLIVHLFEKHGELDLILKLIWLFTPHDAFADRPWAPMLAQYVEK